MAAVMAAAAVLLVAEVMALMMLHVWRWRLRLRQKSGGKVAATAVQAAATCGGLG
jgi:hypothetical protein